jgi:hypothetical protein
MFIRKPFSRAHNRIVISIITLALLWVQFLGLSHSVLHGYKSAVAFSTSNSYQDSKDLQLEQSLVGVFSENNAPNPALNHHCSAWDACTLAVAVPIANQVTLVTALVFFFTLLITHRELHKKLYWNFLSRAPPSISPQ